jgi:3-(3-hydroxy-phenyl)propionate hydroxylase
MSPSLSSPSYDDTFLYEVAIVGAGPVGLTLAIALAKMGVRVVLLDAHGKVSEGSRAICFSKRSLEIFDKLGVAGPMIAKGVKWNVGRIFYKDREIDSFNLSPEHYSKYPAFINLQQYYVEQFLTEAAQQENNIAIKWGHKVDGLQKIADKENGEPLAQLHISTGHGEYLLNARFVIACDGNKSTIRNLMGLQMQGERFEDRFLIADFRMEADFPAERWFWFDPPFAPGQSILLHKQPDNIWRLDFKLNKTDEDSLAKDLSFIESKIKSVVGDRPFKVVWTSIYSFSCKMLENFVHNNVIFAGDSAHVFSPFGARGANSGIEDADNLAWKLAWILKRKTGTQLLQTYNQERTTAARQNMEITSRSTMFIAPPSPEGLKVRNLILENAANDTEAKKQINCGRLSTPAVYGKYADSENGDWQNADLQPGKPVKDCFFNDGKDYLTEHLGHHFTIICKRNSIHQQHKNTLTELGINILEVDAAASLQLAALYELYDSSFYLITPDQYILGRWKSFAIKCAANLVERYLFAGGFLPGNSPKNFGEMLDEKVYRMIIKGTK